MEKRTKRGEQDFKKEKNQMFGEPVATAAPENAGTQVGNMTRDKSVEPTKDVQRDGQGAEEK